MDSIMSALPASTDAYAADPLFELAPASLWLEDFNAVYELLQSWRLAGRDRHWQISVGAAACGRG